MGTAEGGDRSKSVVDRVAETEDNKRSKEERRGIDEQTRCEKRGKLQEGKEKNDETKVGNLKPKPAMSGDKISDWSGVDESKLLEELDELSQEAENEEMSELKKRVEKLELRERVRRKAAAALAEHVKCGKIEMENAVGALKAAGQGDVVSSLLSWYLDLWEKAGMVEKVDRVSKGKDE